MYLIDNFLKFRKESRALSSEGLIFGEVQRRLIAFLHLKVMRHVHLKS